MISDQDRVLARIVMVEGWKNCAVNGDRRIPYVKEQCDCNLGAIDGCKSRVEAIALAISRARDSVREEVHDWETLRTTMRAQDILKKPYARLVIPDADGTCAAEIVEFPGCVASGATPAEALANLDSVAIDWIETAIEQGQGIPPPMRSSAPTEFFACQEVSD